MDVVGQAGKPKTITGFQTHSTPVLLSYGERAELATEECLSISLIVSLIIVIIIWNSPIIDLDTSIFLHIFLFNILLHVYLISQPIYLFLLFAQYFQFNAISQYIYIILSLYLVT